MSDVAARAVIVTGAGRGIGAAIAERLAATRAPILVNFVRNRDAAERTVEKIGRSGGRALAWQADMADPSAISAMFEASDREFGPLGGLVTNHGMLGDTLRLDEHDHASLLTLFNTNLIGAMLCAKEAVRRLSTKRGGKGGSIVNIGSIAGSNGGISGMLAYATSKGAIATFTLALAKEVAREGVRVNAVAPGMIKTDMTAAFADQVAPAIPMGRCGEPPEIAEAVAWLMSDAASYTTGSVLNVSGGR